jgi:hypothetical protein
LVIDSGVARGKMTLARSPGTPARLMAKLPVPTSGRSAPTPKLPKPVPITSIGREVSKPSRQVGVKVETSSGCDDMPAYEAVTVVAREPVESGEQRAATHRRGLGVAHGEGRPGRDVAFRRRGRQWRSPGAAPPRRWRAPAGPRGQPQLDDRLRCGVGRRGGVGSEGPGVHLLGAVALGGG